MGSDRPLLVGAQASEPKGVTIWSAIRDYLQGQGLPMDYALFSTYEAMVRALLEGEIDIAWNAPMAHAQSLIGSGGACRTLAMRDSDDTVRSAVVVAEESPMRELSDLVGRRVAHGLPVSSELYLIPARELRQAGLDVTRDCVGVDLLAAAPADRPRWVDDRMILEAVLDGTADAGIVFEPYLALLLPRLGREPEAVRVVWRTQPFCHCAFTARPGLPDDVADRFVRTLTGMRPDTPQLAEMMELEHLREWRPASDDGWDSLVEAVREADLVGKTF